MARPISIIRYQSIEGQARAFRATSAAHTVSKLCPMMKRWMNKIVESGRMPFAKNQAYLLSNR